MVGILAQVDDIFSWAPRGGKLIGTGWGMRIQGHGYLNILCRCNIRRSAADQREHGFLLDQHYIIYNLLMLLLSLLLSFANGSYARKLIKIIRPVGGSRIRLVKVGV